MFKLKLIILISIIVQIATQTNIRCVLPADKCGTNNANDNQKRHDVIDCLETWQCRSGHVCYFGVCHNYNEEMYPIEAESLRTYFPDEETTQDNERFESLLSMYW